MMTLLREALSWNYVLVTAVISSLLAQFTKVILNLIIIYQLCQHVLCSTIDRLANCKDTCITNSHDITFMDFFIIDVGITDSISHLTCLYTFDCFQHRLFICIHIFFCIVIQNCCDSLRNGLCWNYDNILVFCQITRLICSHYDILIIRKNVNIVCIYMIDRCQHILRTRVHGLTTLDNIIHAKFFEDFI